MSVWQVQIFQTTFGVAPAGDMFEFKIDEIINDLPTAGAISIVGYDADARDHEIALTRIM